MLTIIMAGGRGTRISELFPDIPKPLIPIENIPVLEREINSLRNQAIIVSDYALSKEFFGFEIVRENYRPERNNWKLDLKVNENTELEIF